MSAAADPNLASPEPGLPIASGRETVRELWRLSHGHRARLAVVGVLGVGGAGFGLIPPVATGYLVDRVQAGTADLGTVLTVTAMMVAAAVLGAAGSAVTIVLATRIYHTILAALRERLVGRAMTLPQHQVERSGTGELISRSSDDVTTVADAAPAVIGVLTATVCTIVVSLAGLVALEWPFAAAFVVTLPIYVLGMRWYLRTGPQVYRAERAAMSARAQQIVESQRGYATVIGFGLAEQRHHSVLRASWGVAIQAARARTVQSMLNARLNFAECLSLATVLVTGFLLIQAGSSTIGAATAAMLLVLRLLEPINQLLLVIDTVQSAAASLNRIVGVTAIPDTETSEPGIRGPGTTGDGSVRLREVSFRYDQGPRVLDDIDLAIPTGRQLAVVGASGAGKSTLAAVIAGIHPPETGTVTRPDRTAVITQEVYVFAGTLRENLTLSAPEAGDQEIRQALEATGAAAILDQLPDGLDTRVGSGGHQLTDAQAQQIALARLLLFDPELAIFDEATAEAGSTQSSLLDRAAEAALRGRTGLVIAHRLSQAAACDRIVVMEHGRITETGTHDELIAAGGGYAGLWAAWQAGRDVREVD